MKQNVEKMAIIGECTLALILVYQDSVCKIFGPYPRGKFRAKLARWGLVGIVHLTYVDDS